MDMPIRTADEVDLDRLNSALGFLMRLAQLKIYERFFEEVGEHNLKPGEFSVLWVILHNPGIRQSVLGQRLMIKRAHMTKLIRALEDQNLVSRKIPDGDRRAVEITLTPEAVTRVEQASQWFFSYEASVGANLTAGERQQLTALLQKFVGLG
ncbi:DNA-binding MarR family transcriptional regulator [Neorhizobium galegae]|uniref:MarR family winged helix-turn-helix transcriptional regulator n=1 Tax=Neorhizobium galegae TaxID=399 RepID=UPI001AE6D321|nr:MarR family transcriptional regulator [Neorhizobium galegae]MBP2559416.1 DNA-binding MarR family transcriptional regulator [Neorhizobium galegae]MDQ0132204.1 DNA-binding MarR family transcriptional regulator [Neorhizobium galegae]